MILWNKVTCNLTPSFNRVFYGVLIFVKKWTLLSTIYRLNFHSPIFKNFKAVPTTYVDTDLQAIKLGKALIQIKLQKRYKVIPS